MILPSFPQRALFPGALALLLVSAVSAPAAVLRVKADAPGPAHDGATWATAFTTVQTAVDAATPGDEVWVAAGSYAGSLTLRPRVSLYGGFAGDETERALRDPAAHASVLDAQGLGRVAYAPPGVGSDTTFDGFTMTNGTADTSPENGYGGGILCSHSNPNISNVRIAGCTAMNGGAIAVTEAAPIEITGSVIQGNTGGNPGVYLLNTDGVLTGNTITGNRTTLDVPTSAGGVYSENGHLTLTRCVIRGNTAEWSTRAKGAGGVAVVGAEDGGVIASCLITANTGPVGGVLAVNTRLESSLVAGNTGMAGAGGVSAVGSVLANCTVAANSDDGAGAVVFTAGANRLENSIVAFNASGISVLPPPDGATAVASQTCVYGNAAFDYQGSIVVPGPSTDPRFVNVSAGNFHIQPDSPCRNTGVFSAAPQGVDMDGQPRIQDGKVDIGADESDGTSWNPEPTVMHVRPDGSDAADGLSWPSAKRTLQAAVDALAGSGGEVWVAMGTYGPSTDGYAVATIPPFVSVYGGFTGDETARDQRDWRAHRTVVDGGATHIGFWVGGGYRAVAVDGFTVTNTDNRGGWAGAAIMCAPFGGPVVSHNTLTGNRMGRLNPYQPNATSALAVGGPALVADNVISDNISYAGGISVYGGSPEFRNNTVVGNSGAQGAAVFLFGPDLGAPVFVNNIFAHNTSGFHANQRLAQLPVFRNNCIYDNGPAFVNLPDPTGSGGNIGADPMLADFEMGDNHLSAVSPCVDAGEDFAGASDARDMDGESRILGGHEDIGADEYSGKIPVTARRVVRVKPDGDDAADGATWAGAVKTIQRGVDIAAETGGEVWVAAGDYRENVALTSRVYLFGGFAGSEAVRDERVVAAHVSTIEGVRAERAITATDIGVYGAVDGFTVKHGHSTGVGGGIYCRYASPDIANNRILINEASFGAGIGLSESFAHIHDNAILGNISTFDGGGVYATDGSFPIMERNWVTQNIARFGGGVAAQDASPTMRNNVMWGNRAVKGSAVNADTGYPQLINNTVVLNWQSSPQGPDAAVATQAYGFLANNIVAFNSAGIRWPGDIQNNDVYGNVAYDFGGYYGPYPLGRNGNISADPLFVDTNNQDYRLAPASPARDAGDDALVLPVEVDLDGGPRIQGPHVDMGAYEAAFVAPPFPDAVKALRVSAGLDAPTPEDRDRLNVDTDGPSANVVDLADALRLLRRANGL